MTEENTELRNKLLSRRRSRTPATVVEADVAKEKAADATSPEEAEGATVSLSRRGRDRTAEAVASAAEGTNFIITLARHLGAGHTLSVCVDPNDDSIVKIELFKGTGMPVPKRKSLGPDYYLHIHNPEFWGWENKWKAMSPEEKVEYATTLGVTWDEHENPKIDNMRLTEAVRIHEKVEKYKPQYVTVSQRKHAKELYLADQLDMSDTV